ncbi:Caleosin-domain-containing protein [Hyaloraphidium curvatum]|nr:Caleosin-domain-containing protein [Hyaloraphidium curvatum]
MSADNLAYVETTAPRAPATMQHPVPADLHHRLSNPGLPRASDAADAQHPRGSEGWEAGREGMSVLQKHVEYFDRDKNGVISPWDTYGGFRGLGFPIWFSALAVLVINGAFSYWTQTSWIPDPRFRIYIRDIHRTKHGSDTEVYDTEGRFVPEKFEEIWSKYDRSGTGVLGPSDLWEMFKGSRNVMDPFGWFAFFFEWGTLWFLCADPQGRLTKEDVGAQYDGTLFYRIEADRNAMLKARRNTGLFSTASKEAKPMAKMVGEAREGIFGRG